MQDVSAPRSWILEMPSREDRKWNWLNSNDRGTFKARIRPTDEMRTDGARAARSAGMAMLGRARIVAEYEPPDSKRHDPENFYPSAKAYVDGIVAAGFLPDDSVEYVAGPFVVPGYPCAQTWPGTRLARMILHVTELPPLAEIECISAKAAAGLVETMRRRPWPGQPGEHLCRQPRKTSRIVRVMRTDLAYLLEVQAVALRTGCLAGPARQGAS